MADPFLLAHIVHPLFFDIGGRLSPISIRDQMIRGRLVVDRAWEERLIGPSRDLLVIGAGAAGGTAAIRAAQRGVRTTLIDAAPAPFLRQALCCSRWVDPTQYDWPLDHWAQGIYHWRPPAMPLPWPANRANVLAAGWTGLLNRARRRYLPPLLNVLYNTTVAGIPTLASPPLSLHVVLNVRGTHGVPMNFGMVVSCVGFGTEQCTLGTYTGFAFWDNDPFELLPHLGLSEPPRILISGGGDGALQDFLRIVTTCASAQAIYSRLRLPTYVESELQSAEDDANRAYIWGEKRLHDHDIHHRLHQTHQRLVDSLLPLGAQSSVPELLSGLAAILRDPLPEVELVFPCDHFSQCYGLNRFLVLLIATFLQRQHTSRRIPLRPYTKVVAVTGTHPHMCHNNPSSCHGQPHQVTLEDGHRCVGSTPTPVSSGVDYHVVVIRHGIVPPTPVFGTTRTAPPRQLLPYHVSS